MKDFQDFIDSLSRETVNTVIFRAESSGEPKERQVFMISLYLLEMYHNWLHGYGSDNGQ